MELPVIATYWSGPTAYLTQENSFPLDIDKELVDVRIEDENLYDFNRLLFCFVYSPFCPSSL
jgi:hypothetical protein